ncbi:MAG: TldD/PmbA family protein, partial [Dongiaceae bacterium]
MPAAAKKRATKPSPVPAAELLADLIKRARGAGADAADGMLYESASLSYAQRLGKPEKLEREEGRDLGLRVFIGKRQAIVSTTDTSPDMLIELVARAIAMARIVPEDPFCGIADPAEIARGFPDLDLSDPVEPSPDLLKQRASAAEQSALAVKGITNSEGAEAGWGRGTVTLAASNGFIGAYTISHHGVSVAVLAGEGTGMERDYDHATSIHAADLDDPVLLGQRAGERAVKRLNARKASTAKVPVVFDPRVSRGLLGHLAGAISGAAIARRTSFLKDKLHQRIFAAGITVTDDPHRRRGLASRPFDGECLANSRRDIVTDGVLTTWVLDLRSARQLGL